jgi:hypothetical protein
VWGGKGGGGGTIDLTRSSVVVEGPGVSRVASLASRGEGARSKSRLQESGSP